MCEHADLLESCRAPATASVHWRWWGIKHYCTQHLVDLTCDYPNDLIRWDILNPERRT
ncbi:hypothetical protein [Nocardia terpenica]|uniref:hypothetical protein n=1 Tax=Nocardia terpenica TaxID=455432 RepID=UPI0002F7028F|nr:hypothetical protein [Nocardia terpenica]NQE89561.1 hypothetical protein [Nocardia terpenica]